ncbi:MAG: phosphatase PAP2 family protein [Acidobacteriia bacterium]|nr:phosphatase PAP2 family protein [Terriglobia bacterium]
MKSPLFRVFLCCLALPVFGQAPAPQNPPQDSPQSQDQSNRSVLEVKPGAEAIKNKDLWEKTGYFHPFVRMPKYILQDQKAIWTSPFHTARSDIKWWVIFGTATGALIATDRYTSKNAPDTPTLRRIGADTSYLASGYTLVPLAAGFYFLGTASHSERFRESGMLAFEALVDTVLVELIVKSATDRARPLESDGKGHFWDGSNGPWNGSFPSGHAMSTFALASVFTHEYSHRWWVKALAYGYAGGVVGARLAAKKHFPGDVVAGGAIGWFIGDYVYGKRHNSELDHKPAVAQKVLDHVRIGGGAP